MKYKSLFTINDIEKIVIKESKLKDRWTCYGQLPLLLQHDDHYTLLSIDSFYENMVILKEQLELCLEKKLQLPSWVHLEIGELYADYIYHENDDLDLYSEKIEQIIYYSIWGYGGIITWLYNDTNGSILFKCTPLFNPERDKNYQIWIKKYEPLLIRIIPYGQACEWLAYTKQLINKIDILVDGFSSTKE